MSMHRDITRAICRNLGRYIPAFLVVGAVALVVSGCSMGLSSVPPDDAASTRTIVSAVQVAKTGSLVGTVRDADSNVRLKGVMVQAASRTAVTDSSGRYHLATVPYGRLAISFSAAGYGTYSRLYTLASNSVVLRTVYLKRTPPPPPPPPPPPTQLTPAEKQMFDLVNQERQANGFGLLQSDAGLVAVARSHSQDMIDHGFFSHTSPTTGSPFDRLRVAGLSYSYAGENIAGNQSVQAAHTSLMNSSGHRANILNPNYTLVGIGIREGGLYGMYFTQLFIGRAR